MSTAAGKTAVDIKPWLYDHTPPVVVVRGCLPIMTRLLPAPLVRCGYYFVDHSEPHPALVGLRNVDTFHEENEEELDSAWKRSMEAPEG